MEPRIYPETLHSLIGLGAFVVGFGATLNGGRPGAFVGGAMLMIVIFSVFKVIEAVREIE